MINSLNLFIARYLHIGLNNTSPTIALHHEDDRLPQVNEFHPAEYRHSDDYHHENPRPQHAEAEWASRRSPHYWGGYDPGYRYGRYNNYKKSQVPA